MRASTCVAAWAIATLFHGTAGAVPDLDPERPIRLGDLPALVAGRSPTLRAAGELTSAAHLRAPAAGLMADPMFMVEWWQQPIDFRMTPIMLTLRQPLPWPGTLRAARRVAEREAERIAAEVAGVERGQLLAAEEAFLDHVLAGESLAVEERQRTLLQHIVELVEARYRVGRASQADLLAAQGELLMIDNEVLDLERRRDAARARLNALLDRPGAAPLPPLLLPGARAVLPPLEALVGDAAAGPELTAARAEVAAAAARRDQARTAANPELSVYASYMFMVNGVDTFSTGVSTTLPFFSARRKKALVAAASAEVSASEAARRAIERRVEGELTEAALAAETAGRHERLHAERLIPLATQALAAAEAAYRSDRIDLSRVLQAARVVRDHHLEHARYRIEHERQVARVERLVGHALPRREVAP